MAIIKRLSSIFLMLTILVASISCLGITANASSNITGLTLDTTVKHEFVYDSSGSEWNINFTVEKAGRLNIKHTVPVFDDGTNADYYIYVTCNDSGISYSKYIEDYEDINLYLSAGSYTIDTYVYGLYDHTSASISMKYSFKNKSEFKVATPQISKTKTTKSSYSYEIQIKATYNDYDCMIGYTKYDNSKWTNKGTFDTDYLSEKDYYNKLGYESFKWTVPTYSGSVFFAKFRAYVQFSDGSKYYSNYSNIITTKLGSPKKPSLSVYSFNKKTAKLYFSTSSKVSGYKIYRSTKKGSGYKKIATTKKTSYVNKKLKSNKTYYYKVKAYIKVNGTTISSKYSKACKIKVK